MIQKVTDAIVLAAGSGKRFKKKLPKQFIKIFNENLIDISIKKILKLKSIRNIYVTINKKHKRFLKKSRKKIELIEGGNTRTVSVFKSLNFIKSLSNPPHNILIHDSARPCVLESDLKKLMSINNSLISGVALGYPLTHALKSIDKNFLITKDFDKKDMWLAFTPQLFNFNKIYKSYKKAIDKKIEVDDDAQAMSLLSYKVKLIFSSYNNIKLTFPDDINVAKNLAR